MFLYRFDLLFTALIYCSESFAFNQYIHEDIDKKSLYRYHCVYNWKWSFKEKARYYCDVIVSLLTECSDYNVLCVILKYTWLYVLKTGMAESEPVEVAAEEEDLPPLEDDNEDEETVAAKPKEPDFCLESILSALN